MGCGPSGRNGAARRGAPIDSIVGARSEPREPGTGLALVAAHHPPAWQPNWLAEPKLAQIYTRLRPKGLRRDNLRRFASEGWWRLSIPQRYKAL